MTEIRAQVDTESRELRASEDRFHSLVINSPDAILVIDLAGIVRFANPAAEMLFDRKQSELIGHSFGFPVVGGETTELDVLRPGGRLAIAEMRVVDIEWNLQPSQLATLRDVSDQKRLIDELAQSNQELQQFAYVASHDLQEPLRKVGAFCQLLKDEYGDCLDENANNYLDYAVNGATRMKSLISDLLEFSKVSTRERELSNVSLGTAFREAIGNLQKAIEDADCTITFDELPSVRAEPLQLSQLLQNLLANSIKYCENVPKIHIGVRDERTHYIISVEDNGIGIATEYHDRIFGIFKRLHGRGDYPGTGIGLAICKRIVERWKQRIWVESQERQGSKFFFSVAKPSSSHGIETAYLPQSASPLTSAATPLKPVSHVW